MEFVGVLLLSSDMASHHFIPTLGRNVLVLRATRAINVGGLAGDPSDDLLGVSELLPLALFSDRHHAVGGSPMGASRHNLSWWRWRRGGEGGRAESAMVLGAQALSPRHLSLSALLFGPMHTYHQCRRCLDWVKRGKRRRSRRTHDQIRRRCHGVFRGIHVRFGDILSSCYALPGFFASLLRMLTNAEDNRTKQPDSVCS